MGATVVRAKERMIGTVDVGWLIITYEKLTGVHKISASNEDRRHCGWQSSERHRRFPIHRHSSFSLSHILSHTHPLPHPQPPTHLAMTTMYAQQPMPSSSFYPDQQQQTIPSHASQQDLYPQQLPLPQQRAGGRGSVYTQEQPRYEPADDIDQYTPDNNDDFYHGNGELTPQRSLQDSRPPTPPGPILDHSHLRPGKEASLLSHERTLELYRANAKKTQDPELQFEFAVFLIDAAKHWPIPALEQSGVNVIEIEKAQDKRDDLYREATSLLRRLADRGHMPSQYFLADCYANGIGTTKGKQDFDRAFPLFVLAAKHGHPDAAYRAGTCCENGWGCRRETAKALQFFRKAGAALHPGAQYRLGIAELNGELGLSKRPREGVKWLKRSAEHATAEFPHALHELALLHEKGLDNAVFTDYEYAAELLAQASELGYAPSAYRLGECYEYGKMGCPQDPALSIHYYVRHLPSLLAHPLILSIRISLLSKAIETHASL